MKAQGAKYWIGVDTERTTFRRYVEPGSFPIPQFYLVDPDGLVVRSELPDELEIKTMLGLVFEPALGRDLHEALDDARAAYERGAAGAAWKAAGVHADAEDATLAEDASFLVEKVEKYAAWQRDRIERALEEERRTEAMGELLVFEVRFAKMEVAAWATEQIEALKKHEDVHAERFAWAKLRKALAKEAKGVKSRGARRSAIYAYEKVVKSHEDTVAARIAQERIAALEKE